MDTIPLWKDRNSVTCEQYRDTYCYQHKPMMNKEGFAEWGIDGKDALEVCCACNGGITIY